MKNRWIAVGLAMMSAAYADTLTLKDGRVVDGTYLGGDARRVRMTVGDAVESFDTNDIVTIRFGDFSKAASMRRAREAAEEQAEGRARPERPTLRRAPREANGDRQETAIFRPERPLAPQQPQPAEIPLDTLFVVRMIDSVDSERDQVGQTFRASLDQPIVVRGETIIPRGADVVVKLVDDKQSGRLTGKTELTLDLSSVAISGKQVDILTQTVKQESGSRGAGTVRKAGAGAAIGAVIGGIAGGGAGAAIGAAAGGGAGTAAQVMTRGQRVRIPSETRLTFKLEQAIRI